MRALQDGLGFEPYSDSVHHDIDPQRRALIHELISEGTLPDGYATDEGIGAVSIGTGLAEAVTETVGALAYHVRRSDGDGLVEQPIGARHLPGVTQK